MKKVKRFAINNIRKPHATQTIPEFLYSKGGLATMDNIDVISQQLKIKFKLLTEDQINCIGEHCKYFQESRARTLLRFIDGYLL